MDMLGGRSEFSPREAMTAMDMDMDEESESHGSGLMRSDSVDDSSLSGAGRKRRKQSKPIRVFMDMEEAEIGTVPPDVAAAATGDKQEAMDSQDLIPCDLCNASFGSQAALTDHIQAVHNLNEEGPEAFPTKYHRLGSEFQEEAMHAVISMDDQQDFSPANSQGETATSQPSSSPDKSSSTKNSRIFHPDAYCELCDREFCNRYFLKTHKANKHGIYESGSNSPQSTNGFPGLSQVEIASGGTSIPASSSPSRDTPVSLVTSLAPPAPPPIAVPPVSTPSAPPRSNTPTTPSSTPTSSKPADDKPTKTPDMEDYCEICQKHFCNKYYLKKHKQDVHGIIPETPVNKRSRNNNSSNNASNSINTTQSLGLPPNPALTNGLPNMSSMANVMFINPFAPPVMLPQPMLQGLPGAFVPPGIQLPQLPPGTVTGAEPPKVSTPLTTSAPSLGQNSDSVRGMGILNADAYCDICRKEFCNRYFLKIHLANKHGIYTEDSPPPPGAPFFLPSNGMGFPLPMMGDKPMMMENGRKENLSSEHGDRGEKEDDKDHICKICQQTFPNNYSMRVHQMNVHKLTPGDMSKSEGREGPMAPSIKQDSGDIKPPFPLEGLNLTASQATSDHNTNISGTIFSNMIAAKLADRVVCDICNKEVCNKYFLKTHKLKVHGVDVTNDDKKPIMSPKENKENTNHLEAPTDLSKKAPPNPVDPALADAKRPPDEELLKMGIDPEAYCEICKKEFCSKYFLRTHKLNIHGIKVEKTPEKEQNNMNNMNNMNSMNSMNSMNNQVNRMNPVSAPITPLSIPTPFIPTTAPLPFYHPHFMPEHPDFSLGMDFRKFEQEQRSQEKQWKWREPINATRVMCELCNKELCNKYFLKTHMQNKHGITYDPLVRNKTKSEAGSHNNTPNHSPGRNLNENSNSSSGPSDMRSKESVIKSTAGMNDKQRPVLNIPSIDGRSSEECSRTSGSPIMSMANTIMAKTWRVPEDKRDLERSFHPSKLSNGAMDEMNSFKNKCEICGLIFGEQVTLQLHKLRDHQLREQHMTDVGDRHVHRQQQVQSKEESGPHSDYRSSLTTAIGLSLRKKYQRSRSHRRRWHLGHGAAAIGEKVKSAIMKHIQNHQHRKKYRCAYCQDRFLSRVLCQAHIRAEHPNSRPMDLDGRSSRGSSKSRDKISSKMPVSYAQPQSSSHTDDASSNYHMQSFTLEAKPEDSPNFAASVVYLPVVNKVSSPVTVTFKLTPTEL